MTDKERISHLLEALKHIMLWHPFPKCDGRIPAEECESEPCITARAAIYKVGGTVD